MTPQVQSQTRRQGTSAVTVRVTLNATEFRLSDTATLTISVEGPAPVRVEWLTPISGWAIFPPPPPKLTDLGQERERHEQVVRLEPLVAGDKPLLPMSLRVRTGNGLGYEDFVFEPFSVRVTSEVTRIDRSELRELTQPLELEPPPPSESFDLWPVVLLTVVLAALAWWLWPRNRDKPSRFQLLIADLSNADWLEWGRLLREILSYQTAQNFCSLTTAEVIRKLAEHPEFTEPLQQRIEAVLSHLDAAIYSGETMTLSRQEVISLAKKILDSAEETVGNSRACPDAHSRL